MTIYYSTIYKVKDVKYSSFIYASNRTHANQLLAIRNIGEVIEGELVLTKSFNPTPLPSDFYKERMIKNCIHALTFYAWIAGKAKVITDMNEFFCQDEGLLHEVLHELDIPEHFSFKQEILDRLLEFEAIVPGLPSPEDKAKYVFVDRRKRDRRTSPEVLEKPTTQLQTSDIQKRMRRATDTSPEVSNVTTENSSSLQALDRRSEAQEIPDRFGLCLK